MNLQISRVSEELTSNGNLIVTFKAPESKVEIAPGITKSKSLTYFMAVDGDSKPVVGTMVDLNLDLFDVVERPYEVEAGKILQLKWLHLK